MGFKRIFGQEATKDLLIDFLNDLLVGEKQIKDIRFLDKELIPEFEGDRGVIYDIYCTTEDGEHLIVEMQNKPQARFRERALYYLSNTVVRQGAKGTEWKFNLKAVYGIFFMNFNYFLCYMQPFPGSLSIWALNRPLLCRQKQLHFPEHQI